MSSAPSTPSKSPRSKKSTAGPILLILPPPGTSRIKQAKAKEWREDGYGRLHRPSVNKHSTPEEKLGARFWRGKTNAAVRTKCWSCYRGGKSCPTAVDEAVYSYKPDPLLACGCLVKDKECAGSVGIHRHNILEFYKMLVCNEDDAAD
ncbi:hypothetical protein LTS17_012864 [Exophiala oligosperma]